MWAALRVIFGLLLVGLILLIVVSPYVDLPLTTLRARQSALRLVGLVVFCWAAIADGAPARFHSAPHRRQRFPLHSQADTDVLAVTCALLC